jgi:hypothetical protein
MAMSAPLRQPRLRGRRLESAIMRAIVQTPGYKRHALLGGFDVERQLALHPTDTSRPAA